MTATSSPSSSWYAVKGPNGDLTWRVESPALAVGAKVNYIPDETGAEALYWPNLGGDFPWVMRGRYDDGSEAVISSKDEWKQAVDEHGSLTDVSCDYPEQEGDAAVFTRPLAWLAAHMMEMRSQGIRVSAEVDDNYLSPQRLNIFMRKSGWDENDRDNHMRSVCVGDALILSTEYLRDLYWKGLKKEFGKTHLPEMHVCRNHVDRRFMPAAFVPPRTDGRLRIGYMGSDSHIWDVDLIYEALLFAFELGHEIVMVGLHPQMLNPKYRASKKDWSRIEYTHIPWSNDYRGTALPLDIGFAPLLVNDHTLGKSDIKALEYAMSGAATIAQNCLVYNRTLKHGETVLFANSPQEYVTQLAWLIGDNELREQLVKNTRQYIAEERLLENNVQEWRDAVYG